MNVKRGSRIPKVIGTIQDAERNLAKDLVNNPVFNKRVDKLREKYIVKGFLLPFYARGGRIAESHARIREYGNFILSSDYTGKNINGVALSHIHNEDMWFRFFLREGFVMGSKIPSSQEWNENNLPIEAIWQDIVALSKELGVWGEYGGGVGTTLEIGDLSRDKNDTERKNADIENGISEQVSTYKENWFNLFDVYLTYSTPQTGLETRTAWFHILNYALYNTPVNFLPVFYSEFDDNGKIKFIRFLSEDLSDKAKEYIGKHILKIPGKIENLRKIYEPNDIMWWLLHNLPQERDTTPLSYSDISKLLNVPRSTIQTVVKRFDDRVNKSLDNKLLARILLIGSNLGHDYNTVYNMLAERDLVPVREREIDGFDDLESLL